MVKLDLELVVCVEVTDLEDALLQQGDEPTFNHLARKLKIGISHELPASRVEIVNAGPYNTIYPDNPLGKAE